MQQQASSHAVDDRPERHVLDLFLLSRGLFVFIILLVACQPAGAVALDAITEDIC